jgi:hypothetical protein
MTKRVKAYGFRQLMRLSEKEAKKKEYEIEYKNIKIQKVTKKTGKTQVVYRASNGRFAKKSDYALQLKIREAKGKQIPEKADFYKRWEEKVGQYYRASVAINGIPIANKYYSATLVIIDKKENIDMDKLLKDLLERLEKSLHYNQHVWWFEYKALLQTQEPKPYFGSERGLKYEFHKV